MHFQFNKKKHAERRTLFENGEMAVTLPTAALSGCGFGSLKCETEKSTSTYLIRDIENLEKYWTLVLNRALALLLKHTCVSLREGDEKRVGGKRKTEPLKRQKPVTTSEEDATYLGICRMTMHVT